jgi:ribonuclease BN (tRNA processing enzyme)
MCPPSRWFVVPIVFAMVATSVYTFAQSGPQPRTQVVMLGTGTPLPDPDRAGPSTAIVVNDTPYVVDAGIGIVRRAAAARQKGIAGLAPTKLRIAFLTHLHSDHTLGLPDLILTPWIMGRQEPLELYGPAGTKAMVDAILQAYTVDVKTRTEGLEQSNRTGYKVNVHEVTAGVVYTDANVKVTAFPAAHGSIESYAYRFDTADRSIVIMGDSTPKSGVVANCAGCDVLVHEAYTDASFALVPQQWKNYRRAFHTSTTELAKIAEETRPKLLVLYHRANPGCDQVGTEECRNAGSEAQMMSELQARYKGRVVAAHDLDVY